MGQNNALSGKQNHHNWMVVYITHNIGEAHIVSGRLQHEGIPSFLDHMAGRDALGITIGNWGEVRILVRPEDYDRALDILDPETPEELSDDNEQYIFGLDEDDDDYDTE